MTIKRSYYGSFVKLVESLRYGVFFCFNELVTEFGFCNLYIYKMADKLLFQQEISFLLFWNTNFKEE